MRVKRTVSLLTSTMLVLGLAGLFPAQTFATETPVYNSFDTDYEGWYNTGDNSVAALAGGFNSERAMLVTGRENPSDGAEAQKGFYLGGGIKYTYSVYVKADTEETFTLDLRYLYKDTVAFETKTIATVTAKAGEWTLLEGSFTAPQGTVNLSPIITTNTTNDFRFDEFNVTTKTLSSPFAVDAANDGTALKDVYANYFRVGACVSATDGSQPLSNSQTQAIVLKQFNSLTPENELKPDQTIQQNGSTNTDVKISLNRAATILDFCVKNNIALRGHTLVWYSQTPQWFFTENFQGGNKVSTAVMDQRMESLIKNTFSALKTQYPSLNLYAYDVANEAFPDSNGKTDWLTSVRDANSSGWVNVYGNNSFLPKAFEYAAKYRDQYWPDMKLYYNDYNEYESPKHDAMVALVKKLYADGTLDGVGMQSHLATNYPSTAMYNSAMDKFLAIGCDVQITELDITGSPESTTSTMYKSILQHAVEARKQGKPLTAVVFWGTTNKSSWRASQGTSVLLFNDSGQPNVNYNAIGGSAIVPQADWGDGDADDIGEGASSSEGPKADANGFFFYDNFETGTGDWGQRGDATIARSTADSYEGTNSLMVSGRTATWNGPAHELSTYIFEPGKTYSFGGAIKYTGGSDGSVVNLALQYNNADGVESYANIATATGKKGEWVILENKEYTIPAGASAMMMYFETQYFENASEGNLTDFYIDNVFGGEMGASAFDGNPIVTTATTTSTTTPTDGKVLTRNETGVYNGYDYEFWTDVAEGSSSNKAKMTLTGVPGTGGAFLSEYDTTNTKNTLMRTGKKFGSPTAAGQTYKQMDDIILEYDVNYKPGSSGASYMCVYGWTRADNGAPLVEFYIVESWGAWRPPGSGSLGKVTVDGIEYEIFETDRINQPSIVGNTTFKQYWSVRTNKNQAGANNNIKGTINVTNHFKAWEAKNLKMGSLYEVSLCIEGYDSTGTADVLKNIITIGGVPIDGSSITTTSATTSSTTTTTTTSTSTTTTTLTSVTTTTTIGTDVKIGDINGDDKIGISDLILLAKAVSNKVQLTETQKAAARTVSGSDAINGSCMLVLIKFIAGEVKSLPA